MLEHLQSLVLQDSARKGIGVSMTLHAGAALLLASGWIPEFNESARFSGSRQAITLEASFVEESAAVAVVELPAVQIQPGIAWIAEQRFVDRASVAADWDLPELSASERAILDQAALQAATQAIETARASGSNADLPAEPLLVERVARTQPTPEPDVPLTILEPAGSDAKQPPVFTSNPPPRYPELAKQRGWEGDVLLRLTIDDTGQVTEVTVERSSGYEILDAAAVTAVRLWRAKPARRFGRAIGTVEYLPVQFRK